MSHTHTTSSTAEVLDNAAIAAGTENGTFWASPSLRGLHGAWGPLKAPGQGGNANLQYVAAKTVKILDRPVMIMLLNDVSATLSQAAMNHWDACDDGRATHGPARRTHRPPTTSGSGAPSRRAVRRRRA